MKSIFYAAVIGLLTGFTLTAQTPDAPYVLQPGDWLSKVAERAYGNPHLYYRIVEGTNRRAETDPDFRRIDDPNAPVAGRKIWIPALPAPDNLTGVPRTNCEIRLWYNYQIIAVGVINEKWKADGLDLETRALRAYEMRHEARVNARFLMQNPDEVAALQARDRDRYGNPDGPTFEYLLQKNLDAGMSREAALEAIIESSSRTDTRYNADCR